MKGYLSETYKSLNDGDYISIQLKSNNIMYQKLPWEVMYQGSEYGFLAASSKVAISRVINDSSYKHLIPLDLPIKILLVFSEPRDVSAMGLDKEKRMIYQELEYYEKNGTVQIDLLNDPTVSEFTEKVVSGKYNILHYSGYDARLYNLAKNKVDTVSEGIVLLSNSKNQSRILFADDLTSIFRNQNSLRLIVFNTCYTTQELASALVKSGIPSVVSMQLPVTGVSAQMFSRFFYYRLFSEKFAVDIALSKVRSDYYNEPISFCTNQTYWFTPTLTTQIIDGNYF